jgi:hypothetical protein
MASQDMADLANDALANESAPAERLRRASVNERNGRAALFAAALCVVGMLVLLVGQLGWWTLLAGPAYLAAVATTTILARGRGRALVAVALATGSMLILVALVKLAGLA